jgi:hypothetical protein
VNNHPVKPHPTWAIVDPSKLNDFLECPRKYFFMHMLGWKPETPNNHIVFGQAWHKAMEHLLLNGYGPASINDAQEKLRNHYRKELPPETDELFEPKTPDRAVLALTEYTVKYKHDLDNMEVLYTEVSGAAPISDKAIMHFRMDNILKHRAGYYFSHEHKTGTYLNIQWIMKWPLSIQVGCYVHALYCMYPADLVRGVMVDGSFFKRTKAPLFDFGRVPCWKTPSQMRIWHNTVSHYLDQLETETNLLFDNDNPSFPVMVSFPQRPTSCDNYFGCSFHDFCMAWPNPLQRCDEPPPGYKIEYWDPRIEDSSHQMTFDPIHEIDSMIAKLETKNGRES